mgnify:CR=1 FL=1
MFGSSKKIVLGHKGETIRAIGEASRKELAEILEQKVHLFLFVKVREWGNDPERYREMAYSLQRQRWANAVAPQQGHRDLALVRIGRLRGADQDRDSGHHPQHADRWPVAGWSVRPLRPAGGGGGVVRQELLTRERSAMSVLRKAGRRAIDAVGKFTGDRGETLLMLAPETNGEVAVKSWESLSKTTGREHAHLALPKEDEKIRFRDVVAQPRKIISAPTWSGLESEKVCYNAGYTNVHELIPWRTLTGRQQFYMDHPWMRAFGEALGIAQQNVGRLLKDRRAGFGYSTATALVRLAGFGSVDEFFRDRGVIADSSTSVEPVAKAG